MTVAIYSSLNCGICSETKVSSYSTRRRVPGSRIGFHCNNVAFTHKVRIKSGHPTLSAKKVVLSRILLYLTAQRVPCYLLPLNLLFKRDMNIIHWSAR
jgi:hypothetical protein